VFDALVCFYAEKIIAARLLAFRTEEMVLRKLGQRMRATVEEEVLAL
jgi:hypothetical protein